MVIGSCIESVDEIAMVDHASLYSMMSAEQIARAQFQPNPRVASSRGPAISPAGRGISCVPHPVPSIGDPSLRLKNGSGREDALLKFKCETEPLPAVWVCWNRSKPIMMVRCSTTAGLIRRSVVRLDRTRFALCCSVKSVASFKRLSTGDTEAHRGSHVGGMLVRAILYALALLLCAVIFASVRSCRVRQATLLIISYALYVSWGPWFAAVLLTSTVVNYGVGRWLRRKPSGVILSIGILLNLILLGAFKYLPEAAVHIPFSSLEKFSHLAPPLGISFWTFQAISYLFDTYQGEETAPTFFEFALFMVFFPVTISGPVCRMSEMLPQFRSESALRWDEIVRGLQRIATGVFMMQLAKLLGQGILGGDGIVSGFDHVTHWSGSDVWCLAFGYGLQLFFDFAGY